MKRFLSAILTACFLLAGTGCASSPPPDQNTDRPSIDVPQALHLSETQARFRPVEKTDMDIGSTLLSCLSNGENFVIYSLDPSCQTLWMLT